jgi:CheY-like chemotaxis protein
MPKSVLVADDSMTIRKVIGMLFATEDISLTAVDNGLDAINKARELRPDLVLADCMMPGKNGYEVCQALKADPSTAGIPVLLLSGTFEPFDANRAQAVGASGNIQKPFDSTSFLDRVKTTVGLPPGSSPAPVLYGAAAAAAPAPIAAAPRAPQSLPGAGAPRPLGIPPAPIASQPGIPPRPMGIPQGTQPGMPPPRPMGIPQGTQPGMPPRPMGIPQGTQPGMPPRPMGIPQGTQPGIPPRPMGVPGMPGVRTPSMQGMPAVGAPPGGFRPPAGQMPGAVPVARRDPFGLPPQGMPQQQIQQQPRPPDLSLDSHHVGDGGESVLRDALSKASKEVIEKIAWEVVPQLAETIIRAELERLIKDREAKGLA